MQGNTTWEEKLVVLNVLLSFQYGNKKIVHWNILRGTHIEGYRYVIGSDK